MSLMPPRRIRPRRHPAADSGPAVAWADVRAVLVVRPDNLGDVVLSGPGVRALRAAAPHARVDLLCSPAGAAVAPLVPGIDELIVTSPVWQDASPHGRVTPDDTRALVDRIAAGGYDAMVVLTSFSQSAYPAGMLGHLAGVPVRIGHAPDFGGGALTHRVTPPDYAMHQVDRQLHLLAAVGVAPAGRDLRLSLPASAEPEARAALDAATVSGPPLVVVAPGASAPARRWAPERFTDLVRRMGAGGSAVVVAGTAKEADLLHAVAADSGAGVVAGLPLPAYAALLGLADLVVANNSGSIHLADALKTPVVVTWGGTEPTSHMAPRDVPAALLGVPVECSPCHQFDCPYDRACLDLGVDEVDAAVRRLLAGAGGDAGTDTAGPAALGTGTAAAPPPTPMTPPRRSTDPLQEHAWTA